MAEQSFTLKNNQSQLVRIDAVDVQGVGGKEYPNLNVPLKLSVSPLNYNNQKQCFNLIGLDASLRTIGSNTIVSKTSITNFWKVSYENVYHYVLDFALDHYKISRIEERRKENMGLQVELKLHVGYYSSILLNKNDPQSAIEFVTDFQSVQVSPINIEIPQSQWVSKVLPGMGHDSIQILEIPKASHLIGDTMKISLSELNLASLYFHKGDYDKTVSHCRTALEPVKKKLPDVKNKIESKSEKEWITKITDSTEMWLDDVIKSTYSITSKTHHTPSVGHFFRSDAEIIYTLTMGIIAYAGKFNPDKFTQQ